jgi:hypothetical protein
MTEEQVKTVSELYKEKSNIYLDLEKLLKFDLVLCTDCKIHFYENLHSVSSDFEGEIKKLTISHLQNRIQEIDKQLSEM